MEKAHRLIFLSYFDYIISVYTSHCFPFFAVAISIIIYRLMWHLLIFFKIFCCIPDNALPASEKTLKNMDDYNTYSTQKYLPSMHQPSLPLWNTISPPKLRPLLIEVIFPIFFKHLFSRNNTDEKQNYLNIKIPLILLWNVWFSFFHLWR